MLLNTRRNGNTWFSFKPREECPVRVVILDSYDISTIEGSQPDNTNAAINFLGQHNPNDITRFGEDWSAGLTGLEKRFMPYNGMIGEEQMNWLKSTLAEAAVKKESVIILTHVPFCPGGCNPNNLLWNYQEVLNTMNESGNVIAVFAGHDHEGGYKLEEGVHHITFPSPLLCKGEDAVFATIELYQDHLMFKGEGKGLSQELQIMYT